MRLRAATVAFALTLVLSPAEGQRLEATIHLPDSLSASIVSLCLSYNPVTRLCYVAGAGNRVQALDGITGERRVLADVGHATYSMCVNTTDNKLYLAADDDCLVTVFDCRTNLPLNRVWTDDGPLCLVWNPDADKVYCSACWETGVTVIDGPTNLPCVVIPLQNDEEIVAFACATGLNKVYGMLDYGDLIVFDGSTDTICGRVAFGPAGGAVAVAYDATDQRIYVATDTAIVCVDAKTDSIVKVIPLGLEYWPVALVWNKPSNRLYCVDDEGRLLAIDCASDSVVDEVQLNVYLPEPPAVGMASDPDRDMVYLINTDAGSVVTWEGRRRRIGEVELGDDLLLSLTYNPDARRLFCISEEGEVAYVVDPEADSLLTRAVLSDPPRALCLDPSGASLFCAESVSGDVVVIDASTNRVTRALVTGRGARALCYGAGRDYLYCAAADSDRVLVYDVAADSLLTQIPVGQWPVALAYSEALDKLYCVNRTGDNVSVISGATSRVIATVPAGNSPRRLCLNSRSNKVYVAAKTSEEVTVIDALADTVLNVLHFKREPLALVFDSVDNRVFCATHTTSYADSLFVIDGVTNQVAVAMAMAGGAYALCYNPVESKVYCANRAVDSVAVIDGATGNIVKRVWVGRRPTALCYSRASHRIYCANSGDSTVSVLDASADTLVTTVRVPSGPSLLWRCEATNRVYVGCRDASAIAVVADDPPRQVIAGAFGMVMSGRVLTLLGTESALLFDITGRRMAELLPGPNHIGSLSPGVYFYRRESEPRPSKLVLVR